MLAILGRPGNYFEFKGLHKDALGSVIVAADVANPTLFQSFDAFGQRRDESLWTGSPPVSAPLFPSIDRRGFTGHEHLDNLNLVHMNGRAYAPVIGRFLSADPFIPDLYNSQALNRYSYVYNNPLSYTDPSGFDPESPPGWGFCFGCEPGLRGRSDAQQPRRTFNPRPLRQGASFHSIAPSGMPTDFVPDSGEPRETCGPTILCQTAPGHTQPSPPIDVLCDDDLPCPEPPLESTFCAIPVIGLLCMASGQDATDFGLPVPKAKTIRQTITTRVRPAGNAAEAVKALPSPRASLLSRASDSKLRNRIESLYRQNAGVGNGGTADALRHEMRTGQLLSPTGHAQKAMEMRNGLLDDLRSGRLNAEDSRIARELVKDLQNALTGN